MEDRIVTQIAPLPKPATFKDTTKAILHVAAYARVSTDHEDQQSSLVAQTELNCQPKIGQKLFSR